MIAFCYSLSHVLEIEISLSNEAGLVCVEISSFVDVTIHVTIRSMSYLEHKIWHNVTFFSCYVFWSEQCEGGSDSSIIFFYFWPRPLWTPACFRRPRLLVGPAAFEPAEHLRCFAGLHSIVLTNLKLWRTVTLGRTPIWYSICRKRIRFWAQRTDRKMKRRAPCLWAMRYRRLRVRARCWILLVYA